MIHNTACTDVSDSDFLGRFHGNRILPELAEHRIDGLIISHFSGRNKYLESAIDFFTHFGTSKYNLATHKDQQHDLRINHPVDQARKQLRLILHVNQTPRRKYTDENIP